MKRCEAKYKANQSNPNNKTHQQARDDTANQRNPQHRAHQQSRVDRKPGTGR